MLNLCTPQGAGESLPEYASRVLRYALAEGPDTLTLEQCRHADAAAQLHICSLPAHLENLDQGRILVSLHTCRLAIAAHAARRQQEAAQHAATLAALEPSPQEEEQPQGSQDDSPERDADRAARLLRAALTLIMQPPDSQGGNGGGRPARLQPRPPTKPGPPGGMHADEPSQGARVAALEQGLRRPADDIAF